MEAGMGPNSADASPSISMESPMRISACMIEPSGRSFADGHLRFEGGAQEHDQKVGSRDEQVGSDGVEPVPNGFDGH